MDAIISPKTGWQTPPPNMQWGKNRMSLELSLLCAPAESSHPVNASECDPWQRICQPWTICHPWDMHPSSTWSIRLIWKEPQCSVLEDLLQFIIKSNNWTFHLKQLDLIHSIWIFKEMPLINLWAISGQVLGRNETMYLNIYFIH